MIRSSRRSNAITNKIKTYSTLYSVAEVEGEVPSTPQLQPMRVSEDNIAGKAEEINSDVKLPDTRIPSTPEVGTESNEGDVSSEWNIDEQDAWFEGVFGDTFHQDAQNATRKYLTLGTNYKSFSLVRKYPQTPVAWQWFKKEYINQLQMNFATDSFVKLTWSFMGSNNPQKVADFPIADVTPTFLNALTTKSFLTKGDMWLKIGTTMQNLTPIRQCPTFDLTINNNLERTPALGEDESIENSLGDFVVTGNLGVYDVDDIGHTLYNAGTKGEDRIIQVAVSRKVAGVTTRYVLTLDVHLGAPSQSKNGNKLQFTLPVTLNKADNLLLEKYVISDSPAPTPEAETPVITTPLSDVTTESLSVTLDGTATVTDGGTLSYQWYTVDDGTAEAISGATEATYTVTASGTYKVVVTNTLGTDTATAEDSCEVTLGDVEVDG